MKPSVPAPRCRRSGFALLITITLLAFLVLLLVSLASLTRVETQVAANNRQLAQARQNAMLGLNVALGRLQAAAGPDRRITATADIVAGRDVGKKNWTGVWDASAPGADKNIAWLVSGAAPAGAAGVTGTLVVGDGNRLVDLVDAGSVDVSDAGITGNRVRVESEPITAIGIHGLDTEDDVVVGSFAYWVGDEGVKAKVSPIDPWESPAPATLTATTPDTTVDQARAYRFIQSQRTGIEGVDAADGVKLAGYYPAADPAFKEALSKVLSLSQLFLATADPDSQATLATVQRNRFHDLTAVSRGVLADVARGGLKKDLTAWISHPSAMPAPGDFIAEGDPTDTVKLGLPKWGMIRSYATSGGAVLTPRKQTAEVQGIHPIITYARMAYAISCPGPGSTYKIHIYPSVVLWNPYNVPIQASIDEESTYEFCLGFLGSAGPVLNYYYYPAKGSSGVSRGTFQMNRIAMAGTAASPQRFHRFRVALSQPLAPGQSRIYNLRDDAADLAYSPATQTLSDDAMSGADNSVFFDSGIVLDEIAYDPAGRFWTRNGSGRMEILLTPVYSGSATGDALRDALRDSAYQAIQSPGFAWLSDLNITGPAGLPAAAPIEPLVQIRMEHFMSREKFGGYGATPRWLAQLNPQAPVALRKPGVGSNNSSFYGDSQTTPYALAPAVDPDGAASAGPRVAVIGSSSVGQDLVLREFQPAGIPLMSLAQLQHVNAATLNLNPAYAIGNSLADMYIPRTATFETVTPDAVDPVPSASLRRIYDLSYLLNEALWDGYFFSTIPVNLVEEQIAASSGFRLPNARHVFHAGSGADTVTAARLKATESAAAHLMVDGGFNVNSTSEQAWRALLYGKNGVAADGTRTHLFSRFTAPVDPAQPWVGEPNQTWEGYRILSDAQLDELARQIVIQVRRRGPFLSMADFVNRRLNNDETGLSGALQAALDAADLSADVDARPNAALYADPALRPERVTDGAIGYLPGLTNESQQEAFLGSSFSSVAPDKIKTRASASRAAFSPGTVTQADLLSSLGPVLTARSDTFRIRAYGDSINPIDGTTTGRAWCEAIVQRVPDYVVPRAGSSGDAPEAWPATEPDNQTFGRRFNIISFRWLSSHDL